MSLTAPTLPKSILLIDDDDLIAGSLRQVLISDSYEVDVALDAGSAVALMNRRNYDIVLVDPYLTGGVHRDGCDLVGKIRTLQPAAKVVVLTGYGSPELARDAADGKVSALLTKPQSIPFLARFLDGATVQA